MSKAQPFPGPHLQELGPWSQSGLVSGLQSPLGAPLGGVSGSTPPLPSLTPGGVRAPQILTQPQAARGVEPPDRGEPEASPPHHPPA